MNTTIPRLSTVPALVFDPTGYEQTEVNLLVGDTLEYKQNGFRGTRLGVVSAISARAKPLCIQPLDYQGKPAGDPVHRGLDGIHSAWRDGKLLGVPEPFESRVISYEPRIRGDCSGWIEVSRPGHHNVAFNSTSPGWPVRALSVGALVMCEMRDAPGYRKPIWYIL